MAVRNDRELTGKFKVVRFLGKGSYGSVFEVQRLENGQTYALKEMDVRVMSQAEREDSVNEVRLLASVNHPNVIRYNEAFIDGNRLCIIMEFAPDGDLSKVIKKWKLLRRPMPEDLIWRFFIQIVRGLATLHGMKILHRDIKPGNIMVMSGDVAKIGDLGIAKLLTNTMAAKTQIGTPHYMPPEIWKNRPYSFSSDCWAMGCLMYEMATGNVPFEARSMNELRYKVMRGAYPPITGAFSRDLISMVKECLDMTPERRPTMDRILSSPSVTSRLHLLGNEVAPHSAGNMINTIKVPRGNFAAIKGKLPPANYASDLARGILGDGGMDDRAPAPQPPPLPPAARLPVLAQQPPRPQQVAPSARPPPSALPPVAGYPGRAPMPQARAPPPAQAPAYQRPQPIQVPGAARPYGFPTPVAMPNAKVSPSPYIQNSPAGASQWTPSSRPPGVGAKPRAVSESHAAYGAFYSKTPSAAVPAASRAAAPYGAGNVQSPYGNGPPAQGRAAPQQGYPYQAQGVKLPPMAYAAGGAAQQQAAGRQGWNYGVSGGARAAAQAYVQQVRQAMVAGGAPGVAAGGGRPQPPAWNNLPARRPF